MNVFLLRTRFWTIEVLFWIYRHTVVSSGLNHVLNYRRFMPQTLERWVERHYQRRIIFGRPTLVDEAPLKAKYRAALRLLEARVGRAHIGAYLEFGVYKGTSLACMYEVLEELGLRQVHLFGFDSFEGLPPTARTEDGGRWANADLRCDLDLTRKYLTLKGIDWRRVTLVKGWFHEVLTVDLPVQYNLTKASIIMIDSDLYSSAQQALVFCAPLIQDHAVMFFDDWTEAGWEHVVKGERQAFQEFLCTHPEFDVTPLESYAPWTASFLLTRRQDAGIQQDRRIADRLAACRPEPVTSMQRMIGPSRAADGHRGGTVKRQ